MNVHDNNNSCKDNEKFQALEVQTDRLTVRGIQHLHKKIASLHGFTVAMEQPYGTF